MASSFNPLFGTIPPAALRRREKGKHITYIVMILGGINTEYRILF